MNAEARCDSIEAEIARCCYSLYQAEDPETALRNWQRLRQLIAERAATEQRQFVREASFLLTPA